MLRTTALVLLLVTQANAQCSFDVLKLVSKGTTFIGQNIITQGYAAAPAATCTTGGTTLSGSTCTFTRANYQAASMGSDVATCTGTTWSTPSFIGVACTDMTVTNGNPTVYSGTEQDVVTISCATGFSCSSCTSTCTAGTFAPDLSTTGCVQDCAIPFVTGASINAPCVEGGTVADKGTCTWTQDSGYTCMSGLGTATCATGTALPSPTGCTENFCTAFALNSATTGLITGPSSGPVLGCTDMVVLGPVSNPTCNLQCDTANGYKSGTGTLGCALSGGAPTTSLTCSIVQCTAAFDHTANGIVDPMGTLTACSDVKKTPCTLTCDSTGYATNPMGAPVLTCKQMGDVGQWVLTNPCIGPATCDLYTCPNGYTKGATPSSTLCPAVDAVSTPTCTAMNANNNMACCPTVVACPANAAGPGVCNCNAGYTGTPQWSAPTWTHTCTETTCTAYKFTTGQTGGTSDPCTDGIVLSAVVDTSCNVACLPGYVAATGQLQCSTTGILSGPNVNCVEKQCSAYTLPTGVVGGTSGTPCTNGIVLSPITKPSCGVQCAPGYSGTATTISCGTNAGTPTGTITCTENKCSAYTFPTGVIGGTGTPCVNNGQLSTTTKNSCTLQCAAGYSGTAGTLTCASNAANGDAPTGGITCTPTCSTYTCGVGYAPLATPGSVTCTGGTCTTATCCTVVPCPSDASTVGVCNCNSGWNGSPNWNTATRTWDHVCIPHCANTFFAGCAAGTALVANPSTVNCTGPTGCDMTSCGQCTQAVCCQDLVCTAPGNSRPEYVFSGGNTCTTVTACGTITCAMGYSGTPSIICNTAGGAFSLTGCNVVACPAHASGAGVCNCDTGYAVVGGGGPAWSSSSKTWTHTCAATCDNPSFTACTGMAGLMKKPSPEAIFCTGTSGDPSVDCTSATCCDATCNGFTGCSAMGLTEKANFGNIRCSTNLPSSCNIATCCDATCDNSGFTQCSQSGYQLKLAPDTIVCNGSSPTSCTTALCCDSTDCVNFQCVPGSRSNPSATTCNGVCNFDTCCLENQCTALSANDFPWYVIPGRALACNTETSCGTISCSSGYHADPFPELKCLVQGGTFTASGCVENNCTGISTLKGYKTQGGSSCTSVTSCGTVSCAPGYNSGSNVPVLICATNNGAFQGSGCSENVCQSPDTTPLLGYVVTNPSCTVASACGTVTCAPGFTGSAPIVACQSPGNAFSAAGCNPNVCQAPLNNFPGYDIQAPTCTTATTCGKVTCATGYLGKATITCLNTGGTFTLAGCSPASCPANANGTDCRCNVGYTGVPSWNGTMWTHTCTAYPCPTNASPVGVCTCKVGSTGTPVWNPKGGTNGLGAWTHTCTVVKCPANSDPNTCVCLPGYTGSPTFDTVNQVWTGSCVVATCLPPGTSFPGYVFSGGNTCTTVAGCGTVTCANKFVASGTPAIDCMVSGGSFNVSGCSGVPCPTGAGPAGVCTCLTGYTGTVTWSGTAWTGTCSAVSCPANTNGVLGQCNCATGYAGFPTWNGNAWTGSCTAVSCPANSGGSNCACNYGYTGTPNWLLGTGWTHTCTLAACPTGASGTNCTCNSGYVSNPSTPQWDSTRKMWTHTCTATSQSCTILNSIANGQGSCVCATGYSGTLQCTGYTCTGTCTAVCPYSNAVVSGSTCVCQTGYSGLVCNGYSCTGSCTSMCPYNNAVVSGSTCVCLSGYSGLICNGYSCTGSCVSSNPCASYANTIQTSSTCQCATGYSGNLACNGFVCTGSCTATGSCTSYPNTQVVGTQCVCVSGWSGTAFSCNGFTCTGSCVCQNDVSNNCASLSSRCSEPNVAQACCKTCSSTGTNLKPCDNGSCKFVSCGATTCNSISVGLTTGTTATYSQLFVVNMNPGSSSEAAAGQVVTVACTPQSTSIFSVNPTMTASGVLNFAVNSIGSATVNCQATDNLGATTTFSFVVNVVQGTVTPPTPPTPGVSNKWLRAFLKIAMSSFSKSSFQTTIYNMLKSTITDLTSVVVQYVCPASACSSDGTVCPATHAARLASGCLYGSSITTKSVFTILQASGYQSIVDFDINTGNQDGSVAKDAQRQTARTLLNTDTSNCASGGSCQLSAFQPTGSTMLTDVVTTGTTPSPSSSDSSWDWWVWLLIALGALLLLCCLIALLWFCCKDNKEEKEKEEKDVYEDQQMQTYAEQNQKSQSYPGPGQQKDGEYTSYNDYNYTSAGSDEYYSSYDPTSYAEGGEVVEYTPDEVIQAQYIDGEYYEGTIWSKAPDGTYNIRWYDGSHSEGVPPEQIRRIAK
eukprot:TRINITY_DN693_c0_g1_i1.p1 TRINITY_DN693_c0_g1~~TRINITY_DN693_c0_g1_i1.p1  ORF type:complete len:2265 (+),score=451.16 TRINITY_DN693_c0_g1_i1:124-6918(+)